MYTFRVVKRECRLRFILGGGFWWIFLIAQAQKPLKFDQLVRNDGLSQSSVNCMLRDHEGFMWFGTQDGLNQYDGTKFRVFQNQPGDTSSLSNNYIISLCEDEDGYLWAGTMTGGLNRYDKNSETFLIYQQSGTKNSISENTVWTVLSDEQGNIWSGTSEGLNRFHKSSGKFTCYQHDKTDPGSISTDMVVSLYKDSHGRIWVGTVDGLCRLNVETGKFSRYKNPEENQMPGCNLIWSISETPGGDIITGTNNGVYSIDIIASRFTRILGAPGETRVVAWSVAARQEGAVWVGSDKGLYRVNIPGYGIDIYLHDPSDPQSIIDNNIWCLLPDPSGFLWAGTNNGISKAKTSPALFHLLNSDPKSSLPLSSPKVTAVLEDKLGFLWIGTDGGGLNCISPDRKKNTIYQASNSGLQNNNIWALAEDKDGNIWIGNYQGGLHVFKRKTGSIYALPSASGDPYALSNNRVLSLLAAPDGKVWIGTRGGGLILYDPISRTFTDFQHSDTDSSSISNNTILSMATDQLGRLWIGTFEGGLNLYLPESKSFRTFKKKSGAETSLSDNNVWAILFDKKGRLWLGTQSGLNLSEKPGVAMQFRYFSTRDGLKSNIIFGLEEDGEGNIWMSNFSGLTKLDMKTFESSGKRLEQKDGFFPFHPLFRSFDSDHGLQGLEFSQGAYHKGHSGTLYFGGINGLNYFSANEVKESNFMPPMVITGLKIFNKDVTVLHTKNRNQKANSKIILKGNSYFLQESITHLKELILSYRESVILFEFASLDYSNPRKNQYAYKMVNFDADWNYVGTQNTATYTNLNPGEYTLLVRGSNADGIWNPTETMLKITIVPPFWRTTWFLTLAIILFVLIVFLVIRRIFLNQRRKAQKEKEFIELQLKTIKSQIDPHFAFNAINTIASFIYSEKPDVTYDYFTRFARLIRNILEDNDKISRMLSEEIEFVKNYLELQKMRFKEKFEYDIIIGDNVPPGTTVPKMIIQTYAENAVKHGLMYRKTDGKLSIQVQKENSNLLVTIEDNGVGREKASQLNPDSTHRGLKIMEQIIELYGKLYHTSINQKIEDLTDVEGNPLGTKVILTLFLSDVPGRKNRILYFRKKFM
ncbi:MAG: two-component regulator propeller domain-containing protein [Lentimicrobiaceae bacterium]